MKQIYLLPNRCLGCEECMVACEKVHDWESRTYVEIVDGYFPFPLRCNHCQDAPCQRACPTNSIRMSVTGALVVTEETCIGCGTCVLVCPFGVPYVSTRTGKVVKCDLCDERVQAGSEPVCVTSCPKQALQFGESREVLSNRRQSLAKQAKQVFWP